MKPTIKLELAFALAGTAALLGCATTEALYAEYDQHICKPQVVTLVDEKPVISGRPTAAGLPWEPAVYFAYDRAELQPTEAARLDRVVAVLRAYPELKLGIQGFTDPRGSNEYNLYLARRRTSFVVESLVERGIGRERLIAAPIGAALPLPAGEPATAHAINRRVELQLHDPGGRPLAFDLTLHGTDAASTTARPAAP